MKKSLGLSALFHGSIVAAALFALPSSKPLLVPPVDAVQVDISQITDNSKRKATTTEASENKAKAAIKFTKPVEKIKPAPKIAEEVNTAAREPAVAEPPPPEKKAEPPKVEPVKKPVVEKVEDKPLDSDPLKKLLAEEQKQEEEKKAEEKKQAEAKKKKADEKKKIELKKKQSFEDIAEFLNKEEGERTAPLKPSDADGAPDKAEKNMAGNDDALAATIVDALVTKVRECFTVPPAARDADVTVSIQFKLGQDGSVQGQPLLVAGGSDPISVATAAAAISAITECENYDLPQDRYDLWKEVILDFNPNMMNPT
jgi:hypothetical protein